MVGQDNFIVDWSSLMRWRRQEWQLSRLFCIVQSLENANAADKSVAFELASAPAKAAASAMAASRPAEPAGGSRSRSRSPASLPASSCFSGRRDLDAEHPIKRWVLAGKPAGFFVVAGRHQSEGGLCDLCGRKAKSLRLLRPRTGRTLAQVGSTCARRLLGKDVAMDVLVRALLAGTVSQAHADLLKQLSTNRPLLRRLLQGLCAGSRSCGSRTRQGSAERDPTNSDSLAAARAQLLFVLGATSKRENVKRRHNGTASNEKGEEDVEELLRIVEEVLAMSPAQAAAALEPANKGSAPALRLEDLVKLDWGAGFASEAQKQFSDLVGAAEKRHGEEHRKLLVASSAEAAEVPARKRVFVPNRAAAAAIYPEVRPFADTQAESEHIEACWKDFDKARLLASATRKPQACWNWRRGSCRFGTYCRFSHEGSFAGFLKERSCKFFTQEGCRHGAACRFAHRAAANVAYR